jgi:hypothetical protein
LAAPELRCHSIDPDGLHVQVGADDRVPLTAGLCIDTADVVTTDDASGVSA